MASSRLEKSEQYSQGKVPTYLNMAPGKKSLKPKLTLDAIKKTEKRQSKMPFEADDDNELLMDLHTEATSKEILESFDQQHQERKQYIDSVFKSLSEVKSKFEADHKMMKENEKKLEQMFASFLNCIQQAAKACKQKQKALEDIELLFKKQFDQMESEYREELKKILADLGSDEKILQNKFYKESEKQYMDSIRHTIFRLMQLP